ncbi:transposase [Bacillus cereus]|nr:transposase [Bacillus cereus]MDM5237220.1 transposase [Bacillus cereus]
MCRKEKEHLKSISGLKRSEELAVGESISLGFKIQDVSSLGRSTRLKGIKTGRQYEFLSDLEQNYFYLTEFSVVISDIREWKTIYDRLFINLVNDIETWTSKLLKSIEGQGIAVVKAKHSSKGGSA